MRWLGRGRYVWGLLLLLPLGGCSFGAMLHLGDVTLGWNATSLQGVGGHVAIGVH